MNRFLKLGEFSGWAYGLEMLSDETIAAIATPAGEGGVVILKDSLKAEQASRLRDYGKYPVDGQLHHSLPALPNARMNDFSAAIANVIINNYKSIIQHKEELADIYDSELGDYSFKKINCLDI